MCVCVCVKEGMRERGYLLEAELLGGGELELVDDGLELGDNRLVRGGIHGLVLDALEDANRSEVGGGKDEARGPAQYPSLTHTLPLFQRLLSTKRTWKSRSRGGWHGTPL